MKKLVFISLLFATAQIAVYAQGAKGLSEEGHRHWTKAVVRMENIQQESDYALVLNDLLKVMETDSLYAPLYKNMGIVYAKLGDFDYGLSYYENAKKSYEKYIVLMPSKKNELAKEMARLEIKIDDLMVGIKQQQKIEQLRELLGLPLTTKGRKVYNNNNENLDNARVRTIMNNVNVNALQYYDKGIKQYKDGKAVLYTGIIMMSAGLAVILPTYLILYGGYGNYEGMGFLFAITYAPLVVGTTLLFITPGLVTMKKGKKNIAKSVNMCNGVNTLSTVEMKIGFTGNGIGLNLRF